MSLQTDTLHPLIIEKKVIADVYEKLSSKLKSMSTTNKLNLAKTFNLNSVIQNNTIIIHISIPNPEPTVYQINKPYLIPLEHQGVLMAYKIKMP